MYIKHCFYLLSGLSLLITASISLPLYAQSYTKPEAVKPVVKSKTTKPKATTEDQSGKTNLEVVFKELRNSTGQVCMSLFSGPKGFPKGGSESDLLISKCTPIIRGAASLSFSNLKSGKYAITAFHDSNNDGKMNKNSFGIPEEGFGFSNNPEIGFSAPSFDETKFQVSDTKAVISIKFRYLN